MQKFGKILVDEKTNLFKLEYLDEMPIKLISVVEQVKIDLIKACNDKSIKLRVDLKKKILYFNTNEEHVLEECEILFDNYFGELIFESIEVETDKRPKIIQELQKKPFYCEECENGIKITGLPKHVVSYTRAIRMFLSQNSIVFTLDNFISNNLWY